MCQFFKQMHRLKERDLENARNASRVRLITATIVFGVDQMAIILEDAR